MSKYEELDRIARENSAPVYRTTKSEIVEYYKDRYGKNWTSHAAADISGTTDRKSKEYNNAIRDFQGNRINSTPKDDRYERLGQKIEPKAYEPTKGEVTITIRGTQPTSRGGTRDREIEVKLTGADLYGFVNNPDTAYIWDEYGVEYDTMDGEEYGVDIYYIG